MPKAHPKEFRDDVVAVARRGQTPIAEIPRTSASASPVCGTGSSKADVEDGHRPAVTGAEVAEVRELRRRHRLLEQENEVLRRAAAYLSQANLPEK